MTITGASLNTFYTIKIQSTNDSIRSAPKTIYAYPTSVQPPINTKIDTIPLLTYIDTTDGPIGHYNYTLCSDVWVIDPDTNTSVKRLLTLTEESVIKASAQKWVSSTGMVSYHQDVADCSGGSPTLNWINLYPGSALPPLCNGVAYGCAIVEYGDHIIKAPIYLDSSFISEGECSELSKLTIHELGHAFGLRHSSSADKSIMYGGDFYDFQWCVPSEYDIVAIKALYQSLP